MSSLVGVQDCLDLVDPFAYFPDGPSGGLAAPVGDPVDLDVGQVEEGGEVVGDGGVLAVEDLGVGRVLPALSALHLSKRSPAQTRRQKKAAGIP